MGRLIIRLSFPAMTGMMIYALFSIIDTFFVSKLGSASLAALTLCIPIEILMSSVGSATGVGITSLLSRTLGKQDIVFADNVAWHGLFLCILYGLVFSWLGISNIDNLLILFGCTPEIFEICRQYLFIILLGSLFNFIPIVAGHIVQGEGNTSLPMLTSLVCISLNVVLDPLLIFGMGLITPMGIKGAAMATILAQIAGTLLIVYMMFRKPVLLSWSIRNFRPSIKVFMEIYRVGLPALITEVLIVIVISLANRILAGFSYTAVAALGIFMRIRSLFYMPVHGLAVGVMPVAGFAYGARKNDRVKEVIIKATVIATVILVAAWFLMQFHAKWIIAYFSHDPELSAMGINSMRMATIFLPLMGPIIILNTILQALGKGMTAMCLSVIRQLAFFLPAMIVLPLYLGLDGVWLAFSLSELLSGLLAALFFAHLWKDLQEKKRYTILMMFKKGYMLQRIAVWLKW